MILMTILQGLARCFFPHECVGCGAEGTTACRLCRAEFIVALHDAPQSEPAGPLDAAVSALPYAQLWARRLLQLYKYERVAEAGAESAALFGTYVRTHEAFFKEWAQGAFVMAVPMHPFKKALRGFNQADVFAAAFARAAGGLLVRGLLAKKFRRKRQAELGTPQERARNAAGSIVVTRRLPRGARVILVDDVFTTGSTLKACAVALRRAGAVDIRAVTFLKG